MINDNIENREIVIRDFIDLDGDGDTNEPIPSSQLYSETSDFDDIEINDDDIDDIVDNIVDDIDDITDDIVDDIDDIETPDFDFDEDTDSPGLIITDLRPVVVDEDAENSIITLSDFISFGDDRDLSFSLVDSPEFVDASLDGDTLTLDYRENDFGSGNIVFNASATDDDGNSINNFGTSLSATVNPVNDRPTTSEIFDVTVDEDAEDEEINLSEFFSDVEDANLDYDLVNAPDFVDGDIEGDILTLDYLNNQSGSGDITVSATDSEGALVENTFPVIVNPVEDVILLGDANNDGINTIIDAALIARVAVGLDNEFPDSLASNPLEIGDVNGNGEISALDAAIIAQEIF